MESCSCLSEFRINLMAVHTNPTCVACGTRSTYSLGRAVSVESPGYKGQAGCWQLDFASCQRVRALGNALYTLVLQSAVQYSLASLYTAARGQAYSEYPLYTLPVCWHGLEG